MAHEWRSHVLAEPVHELDDFRWQASLEQDLHERVSRVRYILGRLEDARVPADEGGKHLPRRDGEAGLRGRHGASDGGGAREREAADEMASVGGIPIPEILAGGGRGPRAGDEVLEGLRHR